MNRWLFASCLLTLAGFGVWAWMLCNTSMFPEPVPIHWDIHNQPNGWADARTAVALLGLVPAVMLFVVVLGVVISRSTAVANRINALTFSSFRIFFRGKTWDSIPAAFVTPEDRRRVDYIMFLVVALFAWIFLQVLEGMRTTRLDGAWLLGAVFVLLRPAARPGAHGTLSPQRRDRRPDAVDAGRRRRLEAHPCDDGEIVAGDRRGRGVAACRGRAAALDALASRSRGGVADRVFVPHLSGEAVINPARNSTSLLRSRNANRRSHE